MDIQRVFDVRRERLRGYMMDECEGKQIVLAERLGKSPTYVSRFFTPLHRKHIGEAVAREIEEKLGKPPYWLDDLEALTWPCPEIDPDRIYSLTPDQLLAFERAVLNILDLLKPPD